MRLSHRLAALFALSGAIASGGLAARHVAVSRREAQAQSRRLLEVSLAAAAALAESSSAAGSLDARRLGELQRRAGLSYLVVRDARGRRLAGRDQGAAADGFYQAAAPVRLGPRGRGSVQAGVRAAPLEARLREIGAEGVWMGVTAFLGITMAAWLFGAWAGRRIERVVSRIEALSASPDLFRPLRAQGGDEVSRLAAAFNRMGASLKAETERRRRAEEEKRELSAMLVHDLKTPLTVIRSGVALLADPGGPREGAASRRDARTFELLEMSMSRLQRMVEDILQLSKLEEAEDALREPVDLTEMARACARDFEFVARDRGQTVFLALSEPAPAPVSGDGALLRRVLDNLVHNAVEHTPSGGRIEVRVRPSAGGARVEVSDSGPGVPPEAREHIFRKFYQKDVKRHVGNVGLGLALCEKVVLRHGGRIGIEDAEPRGARFYFEIPAA